GHDKGAFTDATEAKKGLFELAHLGTLFLDEIGDAPLKLQGELLRAVQQREIRRVGGEKPIKVDVRLLAASNKDLRRMVEQGGFREDLYHRLIVISIECPPLRKRRDDIPDLVRYFGASQARKHGRAAEFIARPDMEL